MSGFIWIYIFFEHRTRLATSRTLDAPDQDVENHVVQFLQHDSTSACLQVSSTFVSGVGVVVETSFKEKRLCLKVVCTLF